ncbi:unnamed protein product, partial [Ectocarpus sp. 12 AP-2014]
MDVLKTFIFDNTEYGVDIQVLDDKPIFKAGQIGTIIGLKNVRTSIQHFDQDEKVVQRMDTLGGVQDCTFLTEMGVYRLLMRSDKPMARPFQKWVAHVIDTIRETGKYELSRQLDDLRQKNNEEQANLLTEYKSKHELETHAVLLGGFENKKLVYYGKIAKIGDGKSIIKIGSTANIRQRVGRLRRDYGAFNVFRVFECQEHAGFEKFLHQHVDIKRYRKPVYNGKFSLETYAMHDEELKKALGIAIRNVVQYRRDTEKVRDIRDIVRDEVQAECAKFVGAKRKPDVTNDLQRDSKRGYSTNLGPKIQMYTSDGSLVKTFNQLIDAVLESNAVYRGGINNACEGDYIYCGYRWMTLDRNLDDDTIQKLRPEMEKKEIRTGYVVELSRDEASIVKVYANFKEASRLNGFLSDGAVQKRMQKGENLNGNIIRPWSECSDALQESYIKKGVLPPKPVNGRHVGILKLDPVSKKVVHRYITITEAVTKARCAHRTLKSAIAKGTVLRGFLWKY